MKCWVLAVALVTASVQAVSVSGAQKTPDAKSKSTGQSSSTAPKIRITGYVAACYKPNKYVVFMKSAPPRSDFESKSIVVGADGRFEFVLDAVTLKPGDYYLHFGRTKRGAGAQRFTVRSDATKIELGQIGGCDV